MKRYRVSRRATATKKRAILPAKAAKASASARSFRVRMKWRKRRQRRSQRGREKNRRGRMRAKLRRHGASCGAYFWHLYLLLAAAVGVAQLASLSHFRCKEHFESETPSVEGHSTHFTKDAVYRASTSEGKADEDEPKPGPSGLPRTSGHSTDGEEDKGIDPSKSGHKKRKKKKKKKKSQQHSRRSRGRSASGDAWSRRSSRHRRRRKNTHCDYDSDDSVESSPERYREAKFKINGHILRKKPWLSLERRKSTEDK